MMSIFGAVKRGRKVVVVRGTGYEFTIHSAGAGKIKTPVATVAENRTALNCYEQHNAANAGVKKFSALA